MGINIELIKIIGELSYVLAKAHDNVVLEEKTAFYEIIEEKLGENSEVAKSRFDLLNDVTNPSLIHAYNNAIHELKKNKSHLDKEFIDLSSEILQCIAEAHVGKSTFQLFILDRLKHDIKLILNGI